MYPSYGLGPHARSTMDRGRVAVSIKQPAPKNFQEDPDAKGLGVWSCPICGEGRIEDL